ncbi:MAG: FecR domain-containing protein [Mariniphaga sp.]
MEQLSKYLENKNFIAWVFEPDMGLEAWWSKFETNNPEEKRNIQLARDLLSNFRTTDKVLTEEAKILLFAKVLKQVEEKHHSGRFRKMIVGFMKYAAVAILFFSFGVLLFYKQNQFNPQRFSQKLAETVPGDVAKLIRANGKDILLKDSKSVIQYRTDGKLVVNNDTLNVDQTIPTAELAMNQLIIPYGKTSEVLLPDGTKVFLNAGSRLIYPENFSGKTREVFLVGEAYFDVKHDLQHPFIVQLNDLRLKVLGTRFNISAYSADNIIETVLAEGKVSMEKNNAGLFDKVTELVPGQLASFDRTIQSINLKSVDANNYILWTKGLFQFESTDLSRITKRLERYYNIRFEYKDPLLGGLRISGKMELKDDKDEICDRIARAASVRIMKKGDNLYEILK